MTLTFNRLRPMAMTYSHAKVQCQRSIGFEDRVETNGQTDGRSEAIALPPSLMRSVNIEAAVKTLRHRDNRFFTARRYAGAMYVVYIFYVTCLSVCLSVSVTRRYCIKTAERIELDFWRGGILRPMLRCIRNSGRPIRTLTLLPSGTFF